MRSRIHRRGTNRFYSANPEEPNWHAHECGQFILVETGISHLRTELGAWIVPARRVAWVPPGVRHASRPGGSGIGWVVIPPVELQGFPNHVCVLRASALMSASLQRLTQLNSGDEPMRCLLWQVVAAEVSAAQPERLEVPMPSAPRLLKAAQSVLTRPSAAASLDQLATRAGMSRRSFARHFRSQTGLPYAQWKRAVIAQHALELVAAGHKVSSVALDVGYQSVSAFIAMFRRQYGESPRQFLVVNSERYLAAAEPG
ncbi:MAG TPA: AraC family transcriptional regulator [Steroidobacteraceae bacterium]|jgi:AraC-like DNA-binding protein|nr:AraC family transcriptional regulator [Steroidobacteraceae bacterium]